MIQLNLGCIRLRRLFEVVLGIARNFTIVNFVIAAGIVAYALTIGISYEQMALLVLTVLLSAVPVALPATFTLAAALGARTLAMKGVLLTRLSSLKKAAMIDVRCCDKTGTLTMNELVVSAIRPVEPGYEEADVLGYAALASSAEGQDPIDTVVRAMAAKDTGWARGAGAVARLRRRSIRLLKMAEAIADGRGPRDQGGQGRPRDHRDGRPDAAGGGCT